MPLAAALTALLAGALLLAPRPAHAAFPGRNGPLIEAVSTETEGELGGGEAKQELQADDGRWILGCEEDQPDGAANGCRDRGFAHPAVSPDGRTVVFEEDGGLSRVGVDGSGHRTLGPFPASLTTPVFSPDGRRLAAVRDGATIVIVRPDGTLRRVVRGTSPDWSVRDWIAFIRDDTLFRVRPNGSGLLRLTPRGSCLDASWAPDGRRVACASKRGLFTMTASGGNVRRVPAKLFDIPALVEWSPDGRLLAAGDDVDLLAVVDLRGRIVREVPLGSMCSAETCWRRNGWTWGPRARR